MALQAPFLQPSPVNPEVAAPGQSASEGPVFILQAAFTVLAWMLLFSVAPNADARDLSLEPIPTSNRLPFVAIHGLPPARSAYLASAGHTRLTLHADVANTSITDSATAGRSTIIDGETHRIELDLRRGIGDSWELGMTLPLLRHGGGFLDAPIEGWHGIFGLPNGNRDRLPRNRLLFAYSEPGSGGFNLDNSGGGAGDLQLSAGRQLREGLAWRSTLKLPTGRSDHLSSSGAVALASSLHVSGQLRNQLHWHVSSGLLMTSGSDVLSKQFEKNLVFASGTLAWPAGENLVLKAQLDAHTAAYSNTGGILDQASVQLSLGAAFAVTRDWAVEFGFSEDVSVETAPDIVFHAGLSRRF